jgi:hypothetical protein
MATKGRIFLDIRILHWKSTNITEEYVAYIFRVEELLFYYYLFKL